MNFLLTHLSIIWNGSNTAINVPKKRAETPISINDIKPENKTKILIIYILKNKKIKQRRS